MRAERAAACISMALGGADGAAGKRIRQREKQTARVTLPLLDPSVPMEDKTLERSKVKAKDAEESSNGLGSRPNASPPAYLLCDRALGTCTRASNPHEQDKENTCSLQTSL